MLLSASIHRKISWEIQIFFICFSILSPKISVLMPLKKNLSGEFPSIFSPLRLFCCWKRPGTGWGLCWTPVLPSMVDSAAAKLREPPEVARHKVSPPVPGASDANLGRFRLLWVQHTQMGRRCREVKENPPFGNDLPFGHHRKPTICFHDVSICFLKWVDFLL